MTRVTVRCDLRNVLGSARDQGPRETCLAFALSDAHAVRRTSAWELLSCEYLFYHAKQRDKTPPYLGTTVEAARSALEEEGQPLETEWPYQMALSSDPRRWKPPTGIGTVYRRSSVRGVPAFRATWDAVEANQPVVIAMTLSAAFYLPGKDGVIDSTESPASTCRHAVVAVATGRQGNKDLLLVRNSWGVGWGLDGYAWLSEAYLAPRIVEALTVA